MATLNRRMPWYSTSDNHQAIHLHIVSGVHKSAAENLDTAIANNNVAQPEQNKPCLVIKAESKAVEAEAAVTSILQAARERRISLAAMEVNSSTFQDQSINEVLYSTYIQSTFKACLLLLGSAICIQFCSSRNLITSLALLAMLLGSL